MTLKPGYNDGKECEITIEDAYISKYAGCYGNKNIQTFTTLNNTQIDPEECFMLVKKLGYRYAGIKDKGKCFGGHTILKYGETRKNK